MVDTVKPKKSLGQNFLTLHKVAQAMVNKLSINAGDTVIEIGSGAGAVTDLLVPKIQAARAKLIAVEFDIDLMPILKERFDHAENMTLVNANILNFLDEYEHNDTGCTKFIGSLPYNITSPLLHRIVQMKNLPEECVFLVQKEVGHKLSAKAPSSSYLSVFLQSFYTVNMLMTVDKRFFSPMPKVDGALVKLTKNNLLATEKDPAYERFLHKCFIKPRKMLNKVFTPVEIEEIGFKGTDRPQNYSAEDFICAWGVTMQHKQR